MLSSLITPLIVGLIAGSVSLVIAILAKDQKTSEFRQIWIDALRNDVAQFIGHISVYKTLSKIIRSKQQSDVHSFILSQQKELLETAMLASRIKLRLNPEEHVDLIDLLDRPEGYGADDEAIELHIASISSATHIILKVEWERVKRGEKSVVWLKRISWSAILMAGLTFGLFILDNYESIELFRR